MQDLQEANEGGIDSPACIAVCCSEGWRLGFYAAYLASVDPSFTRVVENELLPFTAFFWFKLFWNKLWLCTDVSTSDQTGYLPWVLSTLCSVCSVQQPGASLCLWHSCETLQKVPRYPCLCLVCWPRGTRCCGC